MEFNVKTGKDLACVVSGEECAVLVKVRYFDAVGGALETEWLGRPAVEKMLRMIEASERVEGIGAYERLPFLSEADIEVPLSQGSVKLSGSVPAPAAAPHVPQKNRIFSKGIDPKDRPEVINNFSAALKDLVDNPPGVNGSGQSDGTVPEGSLKEIVRMYLPTFRNRNAMFKPLQEHFSFDKARFDRVLETM